MKCKWHLPCLRCFFFALTGLLVVQPVSCTCRESARTLLLHGAVMRGDLVAVRRLLAQNAALVNLSDDNGTPPLCLAALVGEVGVAEALVKAGADTNAVDSQGRMPMHYVSLGVGNVELVRLLLQHGAAIDGRDETKRTPLHYAVSKDRPAIVDALLEGGADPNAQDQEGNTPLHEAARNNRSHLAKVLLVSGASPELKNAAGYMAVHVALTRDLGTARTIAPKEGALDIFAAAGLGLTERVTQLLRDDRRLADWTDGYQEATALHFAAACGQVEAAKVLLANGADVNAEDRGGRTPLHWASSSGKDAIIRVLLESGAHVNAKDEQGRTALRDAIDAHLSTDRTSTLSLLIDRGAVLDVFTSSALNHPEALRSILQANPTTVEARGGPLRESPLHVAAQFGSTEAARVLLERGAQIDVRRIDGHTALHVAAKWGRTETAQLLVTSGADPNAEAKRTRYRPLHLAAQEGHTAVAELLLDAGADVDATDWQRCTPLHWAAGTGRSELVQLLLKKAHAHINARDASGGTALHAAAAAGNVDVLRILLRAGADIDAEDNWGRTALRIAIQNGRTGAEQVIRDYGAQE